jgi:transcriptional regulator with XRE-family HTH domain
MRILGVDDLGTIARQRRLDLGRSQADIARAAGVTRQWLVRFEQGNGEVALSRAVAVLDELGLILRVEAPGSAVPPESESVPHARRTPLSDDLIRRGAVLAAMLEGDDRD